MSGNLFDSVPMLTLEAIEQLRDLIPGSRIDAGPGGAAAAGALFSGAGDEYRWLIWRVWGSITATGGSHVCAWVKHNPSKASGRRGDPTFTDAEQRARKWGYQGILMANLGAYVATKPKDFAMALDPIGKHNPRVLEWVLDHAAQVLVGWGNFPGGRARDLMVDARCRFTIAARKRNVELWCLGKNDNGSPKHLLARGKAKIPQGIQPERWP